MDSIKEIKATITEMPLEIKEDLKGRLRAFRSGLISMEDLILNAENTICWLRANDHDDEIPFYQHFLDMIKGTNFN